MPKMFADFLPQQQYCGVCHGALKVKELDLLHDGGEDEDALSSNSSSESFPLPAADSAVGTVHPCGHMFHVSCFHNHNNKLLENSGSSNNNNNNNNKCRNQNHNNNKKKNNVEIIDDEGASVELKSSDEEEDATHQHGKECPTCKKRANLFVEMNSSTVHNLNHNLPLRDAVDKMTVDPTDTDDDADTDIMNYYSFTSGCEEENEDNLFVDTTNVMAHHMIRLQNGTGGMHTGNVNMTAAAAHVLQQQRQPKNLKFSSSDTSTEYHEVESTSSKVAITLSSVTDDTDNSTENMDASARLASAFPRHMQFFDSRAMPTTPSIMITPGTHARRTVNKRVRFFDDLSSGPSLLSESLEELEAAEEEEQLSVPDTKAALADEADEDDIYSDEEDELVIIDDDDDIRDDAMEERRSSSDKYDTSRRSSPDNEKENEYDNDSTNLPLASMTESQDEMMDLSNVLALPSSDSKMQLLWNVSSYEEDGRKNSQQDAEMHAMRKEIDSLRCQLIESEQAKEEQVRRIVNLTRKRELDAVADQSKHIQKLKKEVEDLKKQQEINHQEIIATEEELATTQIQLETTQDDHQQAQEELRKELSEVQEELEQTKFELETSQEQVEGQIKTWESEKEALQTTYDEALQEMEEKHEKEVEELQKALKWAKKETEDTQEELETCEKALSNVHEKFEDTSRQLKSCQQALEEKSKIVGQAIIAKHEETALKMQQEHKLELDRAQRLLAKTRQEWEQANFELKKRQGEVNEQLKAATIEKQDLISHFKESEAKMNVEHERQLEELREKLDGAEKKYEDIKRQFNDSQESMSQQATEPEGKNLSAAVTKEEIAKIEEVYNAKLVELTSKLEKERRYKEDLEAQLEVMMKQPQQSSNELKSNYKATIKKLYSELEREKSSKTELQSQLETMQRQAEKSKTSSANNSTIESQKQVIEELESEVKQAKEQAEVARHELSSRVETYAQVNTELESQLEGIKKQLHSSGDELQLELQEQKDSNRELQSQLEKVRQEFEGSKTNLVKQLEEQKQNNESLEKQLELSRSEVQVAKTASQEETEDIKMVKKELDCTRRDMEQLIADMHASEKELVFLRRELTAAKQALASSTNGLDLQRTSTSTSFSTVHGHDDGSCAQNLQEELRQVKKELAAKNAFIRGQLTLAKGKLIEYVRTKEGELEDTKKELAKTKQALKTKNGTFVKQLQTTEGELQELTSMKETLLATMNDLAEKNSLITKQLEDAKDELAFLAETKQQLKGTEALSPIKIWGYVSLIAVLFGQFSKSKLFLKNKQEDDDEVSVTPPELDESQFAEFESEFG